MQLNDLKINNYISSKQWKGLHAISGIEKTDSAFKILVNGYWHEKLEGVYFDLMPVELTEELLLKSGFEKALNDGYGGWLSPKANGHKLRVRQNSIGLFYYSSNNSTNPLYLRGFHQLQNLYFALTGKELTL